MTSLGVLCILANTVSTGKYMLGAVQCVLYVLEQSWFLIVDRQHGDTGRPPHGVDAICQLQSHGVLQGFCVIVHVHDLHAWRGGRVERKGG